MASFKLFYTCDIHNSELVFRKFLSIPKHYDVDVLILAGDLSGKAIVPIVRQGNDSYQYTFKGSSYTVKGESQLQEALTSLRNQGIYSYVCDREELVDLKNNPTKVDKLFSKLITENIRKWLTMLEEHVDKNKQVIIMPANDDIFEIDAVLREYDEGVLPLGKLVELPSGYGLLSLDHVNPTPWNTVREASEKDLWKMLEKNADLVDIEWNKILCSFHPPPYNTRIDLAPKLDRNLKPVYSFGELERINVGSWSVRKFFQEYKPLVGLHGHIHESPGYDKVGSTIVFNPGSEYAAGVLKGILLEFDDSGLKNWHRIG